MKSYIKTFENFVPKRMAEREVILAAKQKITDAKIKELRQSFKENPDQIYVLTGEITAENAEVLSTIDFYVGNEICIKELGKKDLRAVEHNVTYDDNNWYFDLTEFANNYKKKD